MIQTLKAIYRNGTFIPQTAVDIPEETEVELLFQLPQSVTLLMFNQDEDLEAIAEQLADELQKCISVEDFERYRSEEIVAVAPGILEEATNG